MERKADVLEPVAGYGASRVGPYRGPMGGHAIGGPLRGTPVEDYEPHGWPRGRLYRCAQFLLCLIVLALVVFAAAGLSVLAAASLVGCAGETQYTEVTAPTAGAHRTVNENRGTTVTRKSRTFSVSTPGAESDKLKAPVAQADSGGEDEAAGTAAAADGPVVRIRVLPSNAAPKQKGGS